MTGPVVSVVVIFLNAEAYLDEAIQSVYKQTLTDWELLLVDDGSSDDSTAIAQRWASAHPDRIRLLHHEDRTNRGMSASRNLGVRHARGEFVCHLDGDDVLQAEALETRVSELRAHPRAQMVYGPALYWRQWSTEAVERDAQQDLTVAPGEHEPPTLCTLFLRHSEATPQLGAALFRRDTLNTLGGSHESFRGMYEDQVLALKFAARAPILVSDRVVSRYRQHAASACATAFSDGTHMRDRQRFLAWAAEYLEPLQDPALTRTLRQQQRKAAAPASRLRVVRATLARVLPASALRAARRRLYGD